MNQQNSGGTNVQIGHAGNGNVYNVVQEGGQIAHVQLQVDQKTIREFDERSLRDDRFHGWSKMALTFLSIIVGFVADAYGISDRLTFSVWWLFIPAAALLLLWAMKHIDSLRILGGVTKNRNEAGFIGQNQVVERGEGRVYVYSRTAACIYPNCSGSVVLHRAPPREAQRLGKAFVGICSVCGKDHSHRLDYLWNAYPDRFDWRPLEEQKKA